MEKSTHTHTQLEILVDGLDSSSKETFAFPQPAKKLAWENRETEALKDNLS